MATDGVRVREDGTRLSTTIAVRPTSVDLFTFANQAAEQLADCGIELIVEELDLTGDTMLNQLRWPNDFDTLMWLRRLGPDPDSAVRAFESSRITTEENVADENPSGFTSELVDHFVASARESHDEAERKARLRRGPDRAGASSSRTGRCGTTPPRARSPSACAVRDGPVDPIGLALRLGRLGLDAWSRSLSDRAPGP